MTEKNLPQKIGFSFEIKTMEDGWRFAQMIASSSFAPRDYKGKSADVFLAMQFGSEIGLNPLQSVQSIACINGRPTVWGDAALALVMGSSSFEDIKEEITGTGDARKATCTVWRKNKKTPTVREFTIAQAKKAGLAGKNVWGSYEDRMLQMRARGFALRDTFPDVLKGVMIREEMAYDAEAEVVRMPEKQHIDIDVDIDVGIDEPMPPDGQPEKQDQPDEAATAGPDF